MKRIYTFLLLIGLLCSGCSSSTEDVEVEYTGPWEIVYREEYYGMKNKDAEFVRWFNDHQYCFSWAEFSSLSGYKGLWLDANDGSYILLTDYDEWYMGDVVWIDTIQKATEPEIKEQVSEFESLTTRNDRDRKFDKFAAEYRKLKD